MDVPSRFCASVMHTLHQPYFGLMYCRLPRTLALSSMLLFLLLQTACNTPKHQVGRAYRKMNTEENRWQIPSSIMHWTMKPSTHCWIL
jgi:hypothetical protein